MERVEKENEKPTETRGTRAGKRAKRQIIGEGGHEAAGTPRAAQAVSGGGHGADGRPSSFPAHARPATEAAAVAAAAAAPSKGPGGAGGPSVSGGECWGAVATCPDLAPDRRNRATASASRRIDRRAFRPPKPPPSLRPRLRKKSRFALRVLSVLASGARTPWPALPHLPPPASLVVTPTSTPALQ